MSSDLVNGVMSILLSAGSIVVFVLALFIGFCVIVGFTKTKTTAGGKIPVIKSLDEMVSHKAFGYLPPTAPRGHADPLEGLLARRAK